MMVKRFLDQIYEGYVISGKKYCFILGAGASKNSGIRTGEQLMKEWHKYLWAEERGNEYIQECAMELDPRYGRDTYKRFFDQNYEIKNDDYFDLFDLRFAGRASDGYSFLENELEGKTPSYGYFPLATILANTKNHLVITTNFDSLIEDALFIYTDKHPQVVGHESLAPYIEGEFKRPIVAKIHRSLYFNPLNRKQDMEALAKNWEDVLKKVLKEYIPIVIGYAGGDHTLMSLLEKEPILCNSGIYWCYVGDKPDVRVYNVVMKNNGNLIKIEGFDEIMFQIAEKFHEEANFNDPIEYMKKQTEERCQKYQDEFNKLKNSSIIQKDKNDQSWIYDFLNRQSAKNYYHNSWKEYKNKNYENALREIEAAIELFPQEPVYYYSQGIYLHTLKKFNEALKVKNKAIELAPQKSDYYYSRAITLSSLLKFNEALIDIKKAIQLNSDNIKYYKCALRIVQNLNMETEIGNYKNIIEALETELNQ
ncbi:MAG: hypothetical protein ACLR9T_01180 [Thomasclavelia sp.]|uniref:hypothetical protein n=1 Tax=Thomasclavelia sp. TaxID=3025757 RepID=UPI0039A13825